MDEIENAFTAEVLDGTTVEVDAGPLGTVLVMAHRLESGKFGLRVIPQPGPDVEVQIG